MDLDRQVLTQIANAPAARPPREEQFDFGPMLARGQTLWHDFPLANPSSRPLRLFDEGQALTPCCSAVGPVPKIIPAGETSKFPVQFRPGFQTGRRSASFTLQTDDPERPIREFAVSALLFGEVEVKVEKPFNAELPLGGAGQQTYRIVAWRYQGEGRFAPTRVETVPPLSARFVSEAIETTNDKGVVESSRQFVVELPPSPKVGLQTAMLRLVWVDGRDWTQSIGWTVRPRITATPAGVTLQESTPRDQTILLRSDGRPFRVLSVVGLVLAQEGTSWSSKPQAVQTVKLRIDPRRAPGRVATDVLITTDHPDQATVAFSVLVPPTTEDSHR